MRHPYLRTLEEGARGKLEKYSSGNSGRGAESGGG